MKPTQFVFYFPGYRKIVETSELREVRAAREISESVQILDHLLPRLVVKELGVREEKRPKTQPRKRPHIQRRETH